MAMQLSAIDYAGEVYPVNLHDFILSDFARVESLLRAGVSQLLNDGVQWVTVARSDDPLDFDCESFDETNAAHIAAYDLMESLV